MSRQSPPFPADSSFSHRFLLFAGTTEGRLAAEYLASVPHVNTRVCVATSYGKDLVFEGIENLKTDQEPMQDINQRKTAQRTDQSPEELSDSAEVQRYQENYAASSHFECSDQRIAEDEMERLMEEQRPDLVIDATHPYAKEVTENIQKACQAANVRYLRVLREEGMSQADRDVITVPDLPAAVQFLSETEGNILAATGSKELAEYARIPGYRQRVFPRVLPLEGVVERCLSLGFSPKNLICMQGPFTEALNTALLCQIQARFLVTKDSGDAGGFGEKLSAARKAHCRVVVVRRPKQPDGVGLSQLFALLSEEFGLPPAAPDFLSGPQATRELTGIPQSESKLRGLVSEGAEKGLFSANPSESPALPQETDRFPMFVSIKDKRILVVGGGRIALRRIHTLLLFAHRVQVVAEQPSGDLLLLARRTGARLTVLSRPYRAGDCREMELVVAATDSRQVNHEIVQECRALNIPVNAADCPKECSFYFPGVVKQGPLVVGVTAGGTDHALAAKTVKRIRETLIL